MLYGSRPHHVRIWSYDVVPALNPLRVRGVFPPTTHGKTLQPRAAYEAARAWARSCVSGVILTDGVLQVDELHGISGERAVRMAEPIHRLRLRNSPIAEDRIRYGREDSSFSRVRHPVSEAHAMGELRVIAPQVLTKEFFSREPGEVDADQAGVTNYRGHAAPLERSHSQPRQPFARLSHARIHCGDR